MFETPTNTEVQQDLKGSTLGSNILRLNRRKVLAGMGAAGVVAGTGLLTGGLAGCSDSGALTLPASNPSVLDVLNFALNLEYLEASFYLFVSTGSGLSTTDMGTGAGL